MTEMALIAERFIENQTSKKENPTTKKDVADFATSELSLKSIAEVRKASPKFLLQYIDKSTYLIN